MAEQQQPPYPPAPPYPQGAVQGVPPRPAGVPPMGVPPHMPVPGMKMPPGMKVPPRPMGYPMPAGVKVPPRPVGVPPMGMPPAGVGMPYGAPAAEMPSAAPLPVPSADESDVEGLWNEEGDGGQITNEDEAAEENMDENGFIDDLPSDEMEEEQSDSDEEPLFEASPYEHNMAADLGLPPSFIQTKVLLPLFLFFIVSGLVIGFCLSSVYGQSKGDLPGVVANAEIPKGRPRCGIAQKGQGCVLYLMNAQRREIEAKEFFSMASDVLGVPKFQIETANIRYATMRIPPGYIALLNIPPM